MKYNRDLIKGESVQVYRNLHTGLLSVRGVNSYGKMSVVAHVKNIVLSEVEFKVSERGRARVLREKKKNVHALVCGEVVSWDFLVATLKSHTTVVYNPYLYSSFVDKYNKKPIYKAEKALIYSNGCIHVGS